MNQATQKTDAELEKFWEEHLKYEFDMLCYTENEIASGLSTQPQANVLLESFLIHVRNLNDFFYPKNSRNDDAVAADFHSSWKPAPSNILTDPLIERIHKEVAHLTWKRKSDSKDKEWDYKSIADEFRRLMEEFEKQINPSAKGWKPIFASVQGSCNASKGSGVVTSTGAVKLTVTAVSSASIR